MDGTVHAEPLACWLKELSGAHLKSEEEPHIVWTLPEQHPVAVTLGKSYSEAIIEVINRAKQELLIVSPFMQEQGMRHLTAALVQALHRGVRVTIITHDADDLASEQSVAVEEIRREAERLGRWVALYTVAMPKGSLLHAKVVVADREKAVVGSANLTGPGLEANLEVGVVLGPTQARQVSRIVGQLVEVSLVRKVFSRSLCE
ncbi:MAG: phospholipase D-like domain-containing protein [Bacillota bacterium]